MQAGVEEYGLHGYPIHRRSDGRMVLGVWVEPLLQPRRSAADTGQGDIPRDRRSSARAEWANRTRRTANQHYYRVTCEQAKSSEPCDAIALIHQLQSE